jgi:hypothetical protein
MCKQQQSYSAGGFFICYIVSRWLKEKKNPEKESKIPMHCKVYLKKSRNG